MKKLTIEIDCYEYVELDDYLKTLNGIIDVNLVKDNLLKIDVSYDELLINDYIIKMEIITFLDLFTMPSIFAFDKHAVDTSLYQIIRDDICCEYCYAGTIEDLYEIKGIEKVDSNFYENYFDKEYSKRDLFVINVYYNPIVLSKEKLKEIEQNLII